MATNRRKLLAVGAVTIGAGLGLRAGLTGAATPPLGAAYGPWHDADKRTPGSAEALVAHAILAASPTTPNLGVFAAQPRASA